MVEGDRAELGLTLEERAKMVKGMVRGSIHVVSQVEDDALRARLEESILDALLFSVDMVAALDRRVRELEGRL